MEVRPRSDFLTETQKLVKPVEPVDKPGMGDVTSKLKEDKSTLPEKPKDPKRPNSPLYIKA